MLKHVFMASAHKIVEATSSIHTSATKLSKIMDTAGGGPDAHGGFHRILGGHDFFDLGMWTDHGLEFPKELLKDFITPNGLPLPGVRDAIESLGLSVQTAQEWGCLNIGEFVGGGLAGLDTIMKIKKYRNNEFRTDVANNEYVSLLVKSAVSVGTTNPLLAASAIVDASLLVNRKLDGSLEGLFEFSPFTASELS